MKRFNVLQFFVFFTISLCTASVVFAWGRGHDPLNRFAAEWMPEEIADFLGKENLHRIEKWSHAPDDKDSWEELEKKYMPFSDFEKETIKKHKLKTIHTLHSHKGQAANLVMLTRAFQEKAPKRAAFWIACLLHTLADEAASNHGPLIHFINYYFARDYKMKLGKGIGLDFADVAKTEEDKKRITQLLKDYRPKIISKIPDESLMRLMMESYEANAYMTRRGRRIAGTYANNASSEARKDGQLALAELGTYAIRKGVNATFTAWEYAKEGTEIELTEELLQAYSKASVKAIQERLIEDDSLFTDLIDLPIPSKPYTGFLIEPSISQNKGGLSMASKLIFSSAMLTMSNAGHPFCAMDSRDYFEQDFPSPREMPVLVIGARYSAVGTGVPEELVPAIKKYCQAGGKLLWIGGNLPNMLGEFSEAFKKLSDKVLPVSNKYGQHNGALVAKSVVSFDGGLRKAMGERGYRFFHDPNTKAGWMRPKCDVVIDQVDKKVSVLARLKIDETIVNIAGAQLDTNGKVKTIFLPEYLVSPFLFANVDTIEDPANMPLDPFVAKLLFACLDMLYHR